MEYTVSYIIQNIEQLAENQQKEHRVLIQKLKKKKPKDLDVIVHNFHHEVFNNVDCLECARCCRGLGPRIIEKDIKRISKSLKIKEGQFVSKYLQIDEDNDYVFKNMPCPFLMPDNYCMIYDQRPKACSEYPHTNRRRFYQLLNITLKNISTCPAVFMIVENLREHYKNI